MSLRFWVVGVALVAAIAVAGCSSSPDPISDPADATICVYLQGEVAFEIAQEWLDAAESQGVTVAEWEAAPDAPFGENGDGGLFERREAFVERWNGYDCDGEAFDVVSWRSDELVYSEPIGEYLVNLFRHYS